MSIFISDIGRYLRTVFGYATNFGMISEQSSDANKLYSIPIRTASLKKINKHRSKYGIGGDSDGSI
jgi:hypothetical protein